MNPLDLTARLGAIASTAGRADAARALAIAMGADDLLLLVVDPDVGALVPAAGSGYRTLPGGPEWRVLLTECRAPGIRRFSVPWRHGTTAAVACCIDGVVALLLGGDIADADAALLAHALPLLGASLSAQQELASARGELAAARNELNQSAALMRALDEARRDVDQALRKLDAQARTLEAARHRAEEAGRAKDQFLAMLGHELRNPLAPIVTVLELLQWRGEWSQEHEIVRRQVQHMMRLVDDLLDVARIAGGKIALNLECIALDAVVARAVESVRPLIDHGRHELCIDVPSGLVVKADPQRLAQVLSNLLVNAAKYSDVATPISLSARCRGASIAIDVLDRGIGIEPCDLEAIFDAFEQQERGIDRAQGGLGLGLAIVRNLVQLHGGSVRAENREDGPGSRFTVELPAPVDAPCEQTEPLAQSFAQAGGGRVLVVDDNVDAAVTLAMVLETAGYEVRTAHDGPGALEVAAAFAPKVAVLDIGLPGMDGYEVAAALARSAAPPRLVALTGYGQPGDRDRAACAGFDAFLVKPVDFVALCDQLRQLADGAHPSGKGQGSPASSSAPARLALPKS